MRVLYIILSVSTVPVTVILSNWFWQGLREARAIGAVLRSSENLNSIVTLDVLNAPPADVARFAQPLAGGYGLNMELFRRADQEAHRRGRALLRPVLGLLVLGSGVIGFFAVGWVGLALPLLNIFIVHTMFVRSTRGSIEESTMGRAVQHVQALAVILHRWDRENAREAAAWLETQAEMELLQHRLAGVRHLSRMVLFGKADSDRVAVVESPRLPDSRLRRLVDPGKLVKVVESLNSHTVYKAEHIAALLNDCGLPAVISESSSTVLVGDYGLDAVKPEWGDTGISALTVLDFAYRLIAQAEPRSEMIGRGYWFRDVLGKLKAEVVRSPSPPA